MPGNIVKRSVSMMLAFVLLCSGATPPPAVKASSADRAFFGDSPLFQDAGDAMPVVYRPLLESGGASSVTRQVYQTNGPLPVTKERIAAGPPSVASAVYWPAGSSMNVTDRGKRMIALSWTPVPGAEGYRLEHNGMSFDLPYYTTSYWADELTPGTKYRFKVEAVDEFGVWTTDGPALEASTLEDVGLSDLTLVDIEGGRIKLYWEKALPGSGITGFRIHRTTGGREEVIASLDDPLADSYLDMETESGVGYVYRVYAVNAKGQEFPYSVEKRFGPVGFVIGSFVHEAPSYYRKYAASGDPVQLTLKTEPGADVLAEVAYSTPELSGQLLSVRLQAGDHPQTYTGSFLIPDTAVMIESIRATATKDGAKAEAEALRAPLPVGGTVRVRVTNGERLENETTLTIRSGSGNAAKSMVIGKSPEAEFKGLPPAADYRLSMFGSNGIDLLADNASLIDVQAGVSRTVEATPSEPAYLEIGIKDEQQEEVGFVQVVVTDTDGQVLYSADTLNSGKVTTPALAGMIGRKVRIKVSDRKGYYLQTEAEATLAQGKTPVAVTLGKSVTKLTGVVTDWSKRPVALAEVSAVQNGKSYRMLTDAEGRYSFDLPTGPATVQARVGSNVSQPAYKTLVPGTNEVGLEIYAAIPTRVQVNFYTKAIGGDWTGPHELDWSSTGRYRVTASRYLLSTGNPFQVYAFPGEAVQVCINDQQHAAADVCGTATIQSNNTGTVEIRMEEKGTKASGDISLPNPSQPYYYQILAADADGKRRLLTQGPVKNGSNEWKLPGAGNYQLQISSSGGDYASRDFSVADGEAKALGAIAFEVAGVFAGKEGNGVVIQPDTAPAGGELPVRVSYRNTSSSAVQDAALLADIPAGAAFIEGSAVVNAAAAPAAAPSVSQRTIAIGAIAPGASGTVSYKLRFDEKSDVERISISPKMRYRTDTAEATEIIGAAQAERVYVTLYAPAVTSRQEITVSGIAPPGSLVRIYDGKLLLGQSLASPSGDWKRNIRLPGDTPQTNHALRAEATKLEQTWYGPPVFVRYDVNYPEPVELIIEHNRTKYRLDPSLGVAQFPFIVKPGDPLAITLKFNHPNRARNVRIHVGDRLIDPSVNDKGDFIAIVKAEKLGPIGVSYTPLESVPSDTPTEENIREQLPPSLKAFEKKSLEISEKTPDGAKQTARLQGSLPASKGSAGLDLDVSLEKTSYSPTPADLNKAQSTGVPVYGLKVSHSLTPEQFRVQMSAYIPLDEFQTGLNAQEAVSLVAAALEPKPGARSKPQVRAASPGAGGAVLVRISLALASEAGKWTWTSIDSVYSVYDGMGINDTLKDLEGLVDAASETCDPEMAGIYTDWAKAIANEAMINEAIKATLMLAGFFLGPETFGVGTIGVWLLTNAIGKVLDADIAAKVDKLKADIANNNWCEDPPPNKPTPTKPGTKKPTKKLADPKWMYDPSGYVYEVSPDNRLEGVKATALVKDAESRQWNVWDAEWFGQANPLTTDAEGRYGWDVPEGQWKVMYEKDGYRTAFSSELTVPPPHFDVNVPMISTRPPKVVAVRALPGGSSVLIDFDRHVTAASVNDTTITVTDKENGAPVIGETALVQPVTFEGQSVSKTVRFTPNAASPLVIGRVYEVNVDSAIQGYNGIPEGSGYKADVIVKAVDDTPPTAVSGLEAVADAQGLMLRWTDPGDPDFTKAALSYRAEGASTFSDPIEIAKGKQWALLEGLKAGTAYEIEVKSVDEAGNTASTGIKTPTAVRLAEPVDIIAPRQASGVKIEAGERTLTVRWTDPADADFQAVQLRWNRFVGDPNGGEAKVEKGVKQYTITGLLPAKDYRILLSTQDVAGNESHALEIAARTKPVGESGGGSGSDGGSGESDPGPSPGGGSPSSPANTPKPDSANRESVKLDGNAGSYPLFGGALRIALQEGTLTKPATLQAERSANAGSPNDTALKLHSPVYSLSLGGEEVLHKPIRLTIRYDASGLSGEDPRKLGLYRQADGKSGAWTYVGGVTDGTAGEVTASIDRFGVYAVGLADYRFADLEEHWSRADVELLASRHLVSGVDGGKFEPDRLITRAEFAKLLVRLSDDDRQAVSAGETFSDVAPDAWYAGFVNRASQLGLVQGAGGRFRPDDPVTREEMAVMVLRAWGEAPALPLEPASALADFQDGTDVSVWARQGVALAVRHGLLQGMEERALKPQDSATRAQSAVLLLRLMDRMGRLTAAPVKP
ncbi:hypothetical protein YDYSG_44890 [Paenibacillus tyrfis]|uniref:S-layer homology domain-containing protein n=1 Tax=Paenibacillus tyrfis TaxID=1501230 RepID=UPI0024913BA0|nr:S-layer homology domain-containing protein [Paenibacillus tyrfis]GLI08458.1 hypothetical protein YDYSG_44890 [Paenibacillus tyrfis]